MSEKQFDMSKLKPFSGDAREWALLNTDNPDPKKRMNNQYIDAIKKALKKKDNKK